MTNDFSNGGHAPSWICCTRVGVFRPPTKSIRWCLPSRKNLVGIDAVVSTLNNLRDSFENAYSRFLLGVVGRFDLLSGDQNQQTPTRRSITVLAVYKLQPVRV